MIAHHSWQESCQEVQRPWPNGPNQSESRDRAEVGKPASKDAFKKIRPVFIARKYLCLGVKTAIRRTLNQASDMKKLVIQRGRNGCNHVRPVNEAERGVAKLRCVAIEESGATCARTAEGVNGRHLGV